MPTPCSELAAPDTPQDFDRSWELAKWLAVLAMTLNHVGLYWPEPWNQWTYWGGRICVPVFSFLMVVHLGTDTQRRGQRYLSSLLFWGLVSQPIYALLFNDGYLWHFNILLTWACGVALILILDAYGPLWAILGVIMLAFACRNLLEGGAWMPAALCLAWLWRHRWRNAWGVPILLLLAGALPASLGSPTVPPAEMAAPVIATLVILGFCQSRQLVLPRIPRMAFYAYYPLHLALILQFLGPKACCAT